MIAALTIVKKIEVFAVAEHVVDEFITKAKASHAWFIRAGDKDNTYEVTTYTTTKTLGKVTTTYFSRPNGTPLHRAA